MKNLMLVIIIIIIFSFFPGCTRSENYDYRLNQFTSLLSDSENQLFIAGDLQELNIQLVEKYSKDESFKVKLDKIKSAEAIKFFNIIETINFFYDDLYLRLKEME